MLYAAYEACNNLMRPVRALASNGRSWLARLASGAGARGRPGSLAAAYEMLAQTTLTHSRPSFAINSVLVGERTVPVREQAVCTTPFGTLVRFVKDTGADIDVPQPRVLLVAPLSGHFATLLRNTIETLLPEHDVYITDWHNARDAPLSEGRFGLDEYIDHIIKFLESMTPAMGPRAHVVAVCQSCVQVLAAVALLAEDGEPAAARQHDADGGSRGCAHQSDQGERTRRLEADRVVPAQSHRDRAARVLRRRPGASTRASCSWPRS